MVFVGENMMTDRKEPRGRVTITDLAKAAGYSKTSVSFAFNDPSRISKKAREVILQRAEEMGYFPDPLARNFSLQKYHSIGILLPQEMNEVMKNPYIAQIIEGVGSVCQRFQHTLTLIPPVNESITEAVRNAAVDGLITLGMRAEMEAVMIMRMRNVPFVTIDGDPSKEMPGVSTADSEASYDIMRRVVESGHRKIAVITLPEGDGVGGVHKSVTAQRMDGFMRALNEWSIELADGQAALYQAECSLEGGRRAAEVIAAGRDLPTVIVAMSDIVAIGCQLELQDRGIRVPEDISIVGYDNITESAIVSPALTTVDQPGREKGRIAADMLFRLVRKEPLDHFHVIIPYRIIERGSLCRI